MQKPLIYRQNQDQRYIRGFKLLKKAYSAAFFGASTAAVTGAAYLS